MTTVRVLGQTLLAAAMLTACGTPHVPGREAEPNLASIRKVAWTNTAQELAGTSATSDATRATIYGFGDGGLGGATSEVSGNLVLSAVWTSKVVTVAAQAADSGAIKWRRHLPIGPDGYADCEDDDGGPYFACKVGVGDKKATLWIIADRTGAVRTKISIPPQTSFGMSGDELYLGTFKPAAKDTRLDVSLERRPWTGSGTKWTQKTSFAIEGWGHDGGQGFQIGKDRIAAHSASWQVIVDRWTGRLLDRADTGRWEHDLSDGARIVVDSGDGTRDVVQATLFAPDGRPIAETTESMYPDPVEISGDRVVVGRHILNRSTGRVTFTAPKRHRIIAVADRGRVALVEPDEFEFAANRVPIATYDTNTGKRLGVANLKGNISGEIVSGGQGAAKVIQNYDDKTDTDLPSTLQVIDVRKPAVVATASLGKSSGDPTDFPTLVRTPVGVVATGAGAVRGFVAR